MSTATTSERGRAPGSGRPWPAVALPLLLVAVILLGDHLEGPKTAFVGVLVIAPMLSAAFGRRRHVLVVGLVTLAAAFAFGVVADAGQVVAQASRLGVIAAATVVAVLVAAERLRTEHRLARADQVVAAVTEAIIRPLPAEVGGVALASRYLGAEAEAHVGGDFYEVLLTPHGVRVVLGDVRGKGLSAVRMANYVLGAFRDAARREPRLEDVVAALDGTVTTEGEAEDFVTAVVLEVRDGAVQGISCGHPQPLLVDDAEVHEADLPVDVPLGLGAGAVGPAPLLAGPGRAGTPGVLLHSDGLSEARRPGGPFLDLPAMLAGRPGRRGHLLLDDVVDQVRAHVGGPLRDDVALLWLDLSDAVRPCPGAGQEVRTARAPRQPAAR